MAGGIPITDPVELAWCEFARKRAEMGIPVKSREQAVSIASFKSGAEWERVARAELVRAAGCLCGELNGSLECMADWDDNGHLENHDPRCPVALAMAIEARGKG